MWGARTLVESLADDLAIGVDDNGPDAGVGIGKRPTLSELEGTAHQRHVYVVHILPLALDS
jgi:hypothetical protein